LSDVSGGSIRHTYGTRRNVYLCFWIAADYRTANPRLKKNPPCGRRGAVTSSTRDGPYQCEGIMRRLVGQKIAAGPNPSYIGRMLWRVRAFMQKPDELFRNVPANIHELQLALAGLPQDMIVLAAFDTGVSESTVEELWARTTWPSDLVVTTPR